MIRRILATVLLVSLLLGTATAAYGAESSSSEVDMGVLKEIMERLNQYHLEKPEMDRLVSGAIDGMIRAVNDPFTEYFGAGELEQFANNLDGKLTGIGVELRPGDPYPMVVRVIASSPAENAGLKAGDLIVAVDGEGIKGIPLEEAVQKIRGPEGSVVGITVARGEEDRIDFRITRGKIKISTVEYRLLEENTGYVLVSTFGSETAGDFSAALRDLRQQGMESLVLDLRNNGGGYLQAAIDMTSEFLPPGKKVVSIDDGEGNGENYITSGIPVARKLPVAVVVNENSASASEVLAGALRDYRRAVLVGEKTFGKGVLQTVIPLESGGALKVTTHRYYTPAGISLAGNGLAPDRRVTVPELQVVAALQELREKEILMEFNLKDGVVGVNGTEIFYPFLPYREGDRIYFPLRFTMEALGYRVDSLEGSSQISGGGDLLEVFPASRNAVFNGEEIVLDAPVAVKNEVIYISAGVLGMFQAGVNPGPEKISVNLGVRARDREGRQENSMERGII